MLAKIALAKRTKRNTSNRNFRFNHEHTGRGMGVSNITTVTTDNMSKSYVIAPKKGGKEISIEWNGSLVIGRSIRFVVFFHKACRRHK